MNKNFFNLVRNSQNLAGELRISPKYVENVFKLNKAGLSLLSCDLNSKMEEMLKRWPKIETIKFTEISVFEKTEWLRNLSKTNFEKDIFYHFKDLKDMQKAWKTETLKTVSLVELWEIPEESSSLFPIQLNTSMEQEEKTLQCYDLDEEELTRVHYSIEVLKIQYDCILWLSTTLVPSLGLDGTHLSLHLHQALLTLLLVPPSCPSTLHRIQLLPWK